MTDGARSKTKRLHTHTHNAYLKKKRSFWYRDTKNVINGNATLTKRMSFCDGKKKRTRDAWRSPSDSNHFPFFFFFLNNLSNRDIFLFHFHRIPTWLNFHIFVYGKADDISVVRDGIFFKFSFVVLCKWKSSAAANEFERRLLRYADCYNQKTVVYMHILQLVLILLLEGITHSQCWTF